MHCALFACSWLRTMAKYTVTSLLRSDGSVQTTSRVTLEHLPNFINGNEMQMFIRTHGLAHQQSVQSHGPSRDAPALTGQPRCRSPRSRISRIQLTPGPQGHSDEEEDWGEWRSDGRRDHSDQRRPRSPPFPPARSPSENRIALVPLSVRRQVPDLGIHRFKLRTGCRIKEIAIVVNDVLYYTLPSIAALVFPEPELLKKSWESVYRSLMPHRRSIIEDEQRSFRLPSHHIGFRDAGRIKWSETCVTTSRSHRGHYRSNSSSSSAYARKSGHISAGPHGRFTTSPRTKRTRRRTSLGSSSHLSHAACCRTSVAPNHSRHFSGPTTPICRRPCKSCVMRS